VQLSGELPHPLCDLQKAAKMLAAAARSARASTTPIGTYLSFSIGTAARRVR
jgi:hypothetical protein